MPPHNVVAFPTARADSANGTDGTTTGAARQKTDGQETQLAMRSVAEILRLPESDALLRIVEDYQHDPLVRLLGEADAALEYIDDPRRNRHKQRMSPAFFRRWLRREHEDALLRQSHQSLRHVTAATGTLGGAGGTSAPLEPPAPSPGTARPVLPRSLMHLADQIQPAPTSHPPSPPKGGHDQ